MCHYSTFDRWSEDNTNHSESYFHPHYVDNILTNSVGVIPTLNDRLELQPLVSKNWTCFALENLSTIIIATRGEFLRSLLTRIKAPSSLFYGTNLASTTPQSTTQLASLSTPWKPHQHSSVDVTLLMIFKPSQSLTPPTTTIFLPTQTPRWDCQMSPPTMSIITSAQARTLTRPSRAFYDMPPRPPANGQTTSLSPLTTFWITLCSASGELAASP